MNVVILPEAEKYLKNVGQILYENEYFGFEDTAQKYVEDLFWSIKTNLSMRPHKAAPAHFDQYGKNMKYASFPKSKRTTWYVFFTTYLENGEEIYLVRYIANNHTVAQYL